MFVSDSAELYSGDSSVQEGSFILNFAFLSFVDRFGIFLLFSFFFKKSFYNDFGAQRVILLL